jgi:uncharacterized membrane protein YidH (DUF202 family)
MAALFRDIESQIVSKYRNYYVSYRQLSDAIESLKTSQATRASSSSALLKGLVLPKDFTFGDTTAIHGLVEQRPEVRFVSLLQHEVSKVNHFSALEIKTMLASLRQQERRLSRIFSGEDAVGRLNPQVFPSNIEETELALPPEGKIALVAERLSSIMEEMLVLEHYVKLNIVMFQRIVDLFDSEFSGRAAPLGPWFLGNLSKEPFFSIPLEGLFFIVSRLFSACEIFSAERSNSQEEKAFAVPSNTVLRAKLVCASLLPIQRPLTISESAWMLRMEKIPFKSEDLTHDSLRTSAEMTTAVFADGSVTFCTGDSGSLGYVWKKNNCTEFKTISKEEFMGLIESAGQPTETYQYTETRFGDRTRILENICRTDFHSSAILTRFGHSVLLTQSDSLIAEKLNQYIAPLEETFSQSPSPPESEILAAPSPIRVASHARLPSVQNKRASSVSSNKLIYPKDFMANERSFLAWVSAVSVQAGIGLSLLGKSGVSFIGAVISLVALFFLWYAVFVFVQRFRQLKNPKKENAFWFYSMQLPTYFGLTQVVLLTVQSLVFVFY